MRIRTVKPEFWQNKALAGRSEKSRLLAIGLLNYVDDEGFFDADIHLIKSAIFPFDDTSKKTKGAFQELIDICYLETFDFTGDDGEKRIYGRVINFKKHQVISKPSKSKIKNLLNFNDDSSNTTGTLPPGKEQGTGKVNRNKEHEKEINKEKEHDDILFVFSHWKSLMNHPNAKLDDKREKLIKKALSLGYTKENLIQAIDGCAKSPFHMGENDKGAVYDSLDLILRNAEKIDQFMKYFIAPPHGEESAVERATRKCFEKLSATEQCDAATDEWLRRQEAKSEFDESVVSEQPKDNIPF